MSEKLEACAVTQADREAAQALWAAMQSQGPVVEAEGGRAIGRAMLQAFAGHRLAHSTPANGEQVERVNGTVVPDRLWLLDLGGGDIEWAESATPDGETPVDAVAYVRAATLPGPTQDARERVQALEEARKSAKALRDAAARSVKSGHRQAHLNLEMMAVALDKIDTALGNQEERL